jgi:predicted secreted protein
VEIIHHESGLIRILAVFLVAVTVTGCLGINQDNQTYATPAHCTVYQESAQNVIINETWNNATICAGLNSSLTIGLKENSRTGNQWYMSATPGLQVSDTGVIWYDEKGIPDPMKPGINGIHEWTITPEEPGLQKVKAILQRPERSFGSEPTFYLTIVVKNGET